MQRTQPKKFVSIVWRKTPIGTSSIGPPPPTPALFTRASIRPWSAITLPIAASTELSSSTSSCTIVTGKLSLATASRSPESRSRFRIPANTVWPARASVMVVARPIPELVPVTSAIVMKFLPSIRMAHVTEPCNRYGYCIRPAGGTPPWCSAGR